MQDLLKQLRHLLFIDKASLIACVGGGGNAGTGNIQVSDGGSGGGIRSILVATGPAGAAAGTGAQYYYCLVTLGGQTVLLDLHFNLLHYIQVILKHSGIVVMEEVLLSVRKEFIGLSKVVLHVSDVAVSGKFRISNGTEITNTANIERRI